MTRKLGAKLVGAVTAMGLRTAFGALTIGIAGICLPESAIAAPVAAEAFTGEWRATAPSMQVAGYATLKIVVTPQGLTITLISPDQVPLPLFTVPGAIEGNLLTGKFIALFPFMDGFLPGPIKLIATPDAKGKALDVVLIAASGHKTRLHFLPATDPQFRKFDVARLGTTGAPQTRYTYLRPSARADGLPVSTLATEGFDQALINKAVDRYLDGTMPKASSLLIVRNGKLVLEEYFHGMDPDRLWVMHSVSKSVTSIITGILTDAGAINPDEPINKYFPEYSATPWMKSSAQKGVTPAQMLRMANILGWNDFTGTSVYNLEDRFNKPYFDPRGWVEAIQDYKIITADPDPYFNYNTIMFNFLGATLERAAGLHLSRIAQDRLLTPLGEKKSYFASYNVGHKTNEDSPALAGSFLAIRPIAMAKIGQMMLNRGKFGGKQIVSSNWVKRSTTLSALSFNPSIDGYSYAWWIKKYKVSGRENPLWVVTANGNGGQYIAIVPELKLVVTSTALAFGMEPTKKFDDILATTILPSIIPGASFVPVELEGSDLGTVMLP